MFIDRWWGTRVVRSEDALEGVQERHTSPCDGRLLLSACFGPVRRA